MHATVDVGTNSVLLLIGEPRENGSIEVAEDRAQVTRLGEGLLHSGSIRDEAAARTLESLKEYALLCRKHNATSISAVGTWALRHASNASSFVERAKRETGIDIEILAEEREATLTYRASSREFGDDIAVIDIGGGSTEFIAQKRTRSGPADGLHMVSLPLGSVSLTEQHIRHDPPSAEDLHALRMAIREALQSGLDPEHFARPHDLKCIATAGTATTLMAIHLALEPYRTEAVHGRRLRITDLRDIIESLKSKTLEERKKIKGLLPARADVILAGAELLQETLSALGYADVTISDRGVKWGLFYERYAPG